MNSVSNSRASWRLKGSFPYQVNVSNREEAVSAFVLMAKDGVIPGRFFAKTAQERMQSVEWVGPLDIIMFGEGNNPR
jgi:hypothetical protein